MSKFRNKTVFTYILISLLLLTTFQSYNSNPLPPKPIVGFASRIDGESTAGASVVVSSFGFPNEYTTVNSQEAWQVDISGDTGTEWPDGTDFTVTITMSGWLGTLSGTVEGVYTILGTVILYPVTGPLNADAGGIYNGYINQEILFSGSASGGAIPYTWFWNFGDETWSNEKDPIHIYSDPGTYIVTLTVTDAASQKATDTTNAIIISGTSPTANANGPYEGKISEEIQFNGDVEGGNPPYIYMWDFGDGETSDVKNPIHVYDEIGEYIINFTVIDDIGISDSDITSCLVTIYNNPPIKPLISGEVEGKSGEEYQYNFVTLDLEDDDVFYLVDWGDGNTSGWLGPFESGQSIDLKHIWTKQGYYDIRAKCKDFHGDESDWTIFEVSMPRINNIFNSYILRLIDRFPILGFLL
jgi:PKD repeat protein